MLICPICAQPLLTEEKRALCPAGHSFDRARQGYLNLLNDPTGKGHGDDAEMLRARRLFLEAGHYGFLAEKIAEEAVCRLPEGGVLLDAGCGEGYYTRIAYDALERAGKSPKIYAFDIAKDAVRFTATRMEKKGQFFVASTFHIPMRDYSADVILSLFSPYSEEEFLRVLRPGGILIRAVPMENHLYGLKCAVYEKPTKNVSAATIGAGFETLVTHRLQKEIHLQKKEEIAALFGMTPYAHKTGREDMKKLEALEEITTELDFGVLLYRKRS